MPAAGMVRRLREGESGLLSYIQVLVDEDGRTGRFIVTRGKVILPGSQARSDVAYSKANMF